MSEEERELQVIADKQVVMTEDPSPYFGSSTKRVTKEQEIVLTEKVADDDLDILPTGEVYLSQIGYRRRLNKAFGPGGWALVARSPLKLQGNTVCREYALFVEGRFIAEAIGEQEYQPNNSRMSYATAAESAKSNALMRCCKDLLIASECWDKRFTEEFKKKYCILIDNPNQNSRTKKIWVRKGKEEQVKEEMTQKSTQTSQEPQSQEGKPPASDGIRRITPGQVKLVWARMKVSGKTEIKVREWLAENTGVEGIADIPADKINAVIQFLDSK